MRLHGGYRGQVLHTEGVDPAAEPLDLKAIILQFFIPADMIPDVLEDCSADESSSIIDVLHLLTLKHLAAKYDIYIDVYNKALEDSS